jgi:ParB family chromosome partitioning protein
LTAGHARALVASDSPAELAREIIRLRLNVRDAERLAQSGGSTVGRRPQRRAEKDSDLRDAERRLTEALGLKVEIAGTAAKGRVIVQYRSLEQLDEVCRRLERQ